MSATKEEQVPVNIEVENIGGIDETSVTFSPGVTVLEGRNATNRTSLLQAIMAALGSDDVSLKADADEASAELQLGGETYTRTLERRNGTIHTTGEPYLDDPTVADLFAFLLESNEARRAVVTDADLREVIMRPVDTDEIQAEIDRLVEERRRLTEELDELADLKKRLPALEEERTQLQKQIEETEAELEAVEERLEAADADVDQSQAEQAELEKRLDDLSEKRSTLEDVRYDLETERESLDALRSEKAEIEEEQAALPDTPAGELEEIETRIDQLRDEKRQLETEVSDLRSVVQFNEEMLDEASGGILDALETDGDDAAVTDELLADDSVTCWTCGSEVEGEQIENTLDRLRQLTRETVGEIDSIEDEIADLDAQRDKLQKDQQRREELDRRRRNLEAEIENTEARIETLTGRREDLRAEIEAIEAEVEELEDNAYEEILSLHREANQLEYDLGSLETDLERVEENIASVEARLDEEADIEARRDELSEEIESLRTRIRRIEQQAIDGFNDHMNTVLERLEYENLARIWLERSETQVKQGRRTTTKSVFELHVVRRTASGTTYEDTVENLSESEREVTGLIFALAGYLAHEVYETVPFMLLDSLEAIDSERIATLVEYFRDYSPYLVVALLPEDAAALPDEYQYIEEV